MAFLAPVTLPWTYVPNALGPVITPTASGFSITRASGVNGYNQWAYLSLPAVTVSTGGALDFALTVTKISPLTEIKLTLTNGIILRYNPAAHKFQYAYYTTDFVVLGDSSIEINDGKAHKVALKLQSTGVQIVEDGVVKGFHTTDTGTPSKVEFDWQILASGAELNATVTQVRAGSLTDLD
ncbi:hypothetical protein B0H16DRAFT_1721875 [Mycena metata]|uniref:Uncharacterized protein n=1 Tax=Mycena metata TaxID=1033252 RepID=A0AAD7J6S6_9AGAR|nr:hypothetical protein B0H16DRAFT_1721875 [Mycena metata]